jgi:uncharacterized protein (DUF1015 family)
MAEIKPFKGLVYNIDLLDDPAKVMAPPYDVISGEKREDLYDNSEFNVVRLILGKDLPGDGEKDNRYVRARKLMKEWIDKGVLATDPEEAFYVYRQEYLVEGRRSSRIGFLGVMKLEGPEVVLPHEHTLSKPKEDRMRLIREVQTNLSPIFGLYGEDGGHVSGILKQAVSDLPPAMDIEIDGQRHTLWRLSDSAAISGVSVAMEGKKIFIADGHHRYAVAKAYRDICSSRPGYDGRADHVLMYLTDMSDPENLTVLATHRVISGMGNKDAISRLGEYFNITKFQDLNDLMAAMSTSRQKSYVYGYYDGLGFALLEPLEGEALRGMITDKPESWKDLDVSVLHYSVLNKVLGFEAGEGDITYVKDPEEAEQIVREGEGEKTAFFLNPTRIDQLKAVAESGEMMPQKSTYFYPKLLTGLVMNRFEDQKEKVR